MFLKNTFEKYPDVRNLIFFGVSLAIAWKQIQLFAQSQEEPIEEERIEMLRPDGKSLGKKGQLIPEGAPTGANKPEDVGLNAGKNFSSLNTKEKACKVFEGKIITYYDIISLISNCKQRQIHEPHILTQLLTDRHLVIEEVPASVYRLFPFGDNFTREDILTNRKTGSKKATPEECKYFEKKYLSASGLNYYYLENCKLRAFEDYYALQEHNTTKDTLISVSPDQLSRFQKGSPMLVKSKREEALMMKMDGDVGWSRLNKETISGTQKQDSPDSLWQRERNMEKPVDKNAVCKAREGKLVSFYSQIYYIEGCKKRNVFDFNINIQKIMEEKVGSVVDLNGKEFKSFGNGKKIRSEELLVLLNQKSPTTSDP